MIGERWRDRRGGIGDAEKGRSGGRWRIRGAQKGAVRMEITVNGEKVSCERGVTLESLMEALGYEKKKIAVEVNGEIVPKADYERCILGEADKLEVVTFVGGG